MASALLESHYDERYIFYEYSREGFDKEYNRSIIEYDEKAWKIKMFDMKDVSNAIILYSTVYWLPLEIPVIGGLLYRLRIFNLWLQHWLIVFECKFEEEDLSYLSFEKNKKGIIAQYSKKKDDVLENLPTKKRMYYKMIGTVKGGDLDFTTHLSNVLGLKDLSVKKVIEKWDLVSNYILPKSNCQTLVYDLNEVIGEISSEEGVKFKFPGFKKISLMSDREVINEMITNYSEDCFKKEIFKVTYLPRTLVSIENTEFAKSNDVHHLRYLELEVKDKIDELIYSSLKKKNVKGLYISNLNKNKMEINLKDGIKNEKNLDDRLFLYIAAFWGREIDCVILSEKYGAIVVETTVDQEEIEAETDEEMPNDIMLKELIKIGTVPIEEEIEVPITAIKIQVVKEKEEILHYKVEGNNIKIGETSLLKKFDDIEKQFHESFEHFLELIEKRRTNRAIKQMKFLAGCLLIFQNTADYKDVLYCNVTNQELDTESNFIVWSPEQKLIYYGITYSLLWDNRRPILHLICGGPGTGKTLILLHAVRHYCARWQNKKVLIVVNKQFTSLHEQIRSKMKDLIEDEKSVSICSKLKLINLINVGLIVFDEFFDFHEIGKSIFRKLCKVPIISATMSKEKPTLLREYFHNHEVSRRHLIGVNYRSDKAIIKLVNEVQKNMTYLTYLTLPYMILSTQPVCLRYMTKGGLIKLDDKTTVEGDNTFERKDFIDGCVGYILSILQKTEDVKEKILIYNICHYNLLLRIKKQLEDLASRTEGITLDQFRNLEFKDSRECCGVEYPISIGIYDHMSVPFDLYEDIIIHLTRTILHAHLLINIATTVPDSYVLDHQSSLKCKKLSPYTTYCADDDELNHVLSDLKDEGKRVYHFGLERDNSTCGGPDLERWRNADVIVLRNCEFYSTSRVHVKCPIQSTSAMFVVLYSRKDETLKEEMRDLLVNRFQKAILDYSGTSLKRTSKDFVRFRELSALERFHCNC